MDILNRGPGIQQPAGTPDVRVEEVLGHALALSVQEQQQVLREIVPVTLPRLEEGDRQQFIDSLRQVPSGDARLDPPKIAERVERVGAEQVVQEFLRQSLATQLHILHLLSTRCLHELRGTDRSNFLRELDEELLRAPAGENVPTPTVH